MAHAAAEELGGIPMSPSLQTTLLRAREYATGQSQAEVSLEHLLLALSEDDDAAAVLQSCDVDLARLRNDVAGYLGSTGEQAPPGKPPAISAGLTQILKYATLAAKQGRRPIIDGAIVLAAIVGDGRSMAASFLKAQGLTFQATVRVLQQATRDGRPASSPAPGPAQPAPAPQPPQQTQQPRPAMPSPAATARPAPEVQQPATAPPPREPQPSQPIPRPPRAPAQQPADAEDILAAARARIVSRLPAGAIAADPEDEQAPPHQNGYAPPDGPPAHAVARTAPPPASQPPELPPAAPAATWTPPPLPSATPGSVPPPSGIRPPLAPLAPHARGPVPAPPSPFPPAGPQGQPIPTASPPSAPVPPPWGTPQDDRLAPPSEPLPTGWPPQSAPRSEPYAPTPPGPRVPAIESSQVSHSIPRHMTIGKPLTIEVSINRPPLNAAGGPSRHAPERRTVVTARAVSVRLRPAKGRFVIDQPSAETQWDKAIDGGRLQTEAAIWRFVIVPQSQGASDLVLMVAARTIAADGMIVETALPDQIVSVRVRRDWRRTLHTTAMLTLIGVASVVVGQIIDDLPGFDVIKRLRALIGL